MEENDISDVINKFSDILKDKDIDINNFVNNEKKDETEQSTNQNNESNNSRI